MIQSFNCKKTEKLFMRLTVKAQWKSFSDVALRKLNYLHAAEQIEDLRAPLAIGSKS